MSSKILKRIIQRLLQCPAVAYHESLVAAEVIQICAEAGIAWEADPFGNLILRLDQAAGRPFVLAAHMDHPGFEILEQTSGKTFRAQFLGGVPPDYFKLGIRLRLLPGGQPARLGKRTKSSGHFEVIAKTALTAVPKFAVWELADFESRGKLIQGRACDDLVGVAVILATLVELKQSGASANVIGILSRAEEVGFHGALTVAESRRIPANALIISLETSREMPPVKMGEGVIIRVGDRSSTFDSKATRFLVQIGERIKAKKKSFKLQRALMSGGTCEATAYQEFGYQTAAVCVALGNYHNCGPDKKIAAEFINLSDAEGMLELMKAAALGLPDYALLTEQLPNRLKKLAAQAHEEFARRGN